MLKKIFGKKNNGYYLELKETAEEVLSSAKETAEEVLSSTKDVVENQVSSAQEAVESQAASTKKAVKKQVQAVDNKTESTLKTKEEKPKRQKPETNQPNGGASSYEPPFWVKAMYNKSSGNGNGKVTQSKQTFATDYLMPVVSKSRRRPGPSLNKFKDMANKSKAPRS